MDGPNGKQENPLSCLLFKNQIFFFQIDNPLTLLGTPYEGPSTKKSLELSWKLVAKDPL